MVFFGREQMGNPKGDKHNNNKDLREKHCKRSKTIKWENTEHKQNKKAVLSQR